MQGKKDGPMDCYSCCFTGHRLLPKDALPQLRRNLLLRMTALIEEREVRFFYSGAAVGFDTLAAECVLSLKERYPSIQLLLALPCRDQDARWPQEARERYRRLCQAAQGTVLLAEQYFDGCMQQRNRFLVDQSAYCVYYQNHPGGGTGYTLRYARQKGLALFRVTERPEEALPQLRMEPPAGRFPPKP